MTPQACGGAGLAISRFYTSVRSDFMRELTHALTQDDLADVALPYVCESTEPAAVEALVELLARPHRAALALPAVEALAAVNGPLATQALIDALDSPLATVRLAAVEGLIPRELS